MTCNVRDVELVTIFLVDGVMLLKHPLLSRLVVDDCAPHETTEPPRVKTTPVEQIWTKRELTSLESARRLEV